MAVGVGLAAVVVSWCGGVNGEGGRGVKEGGRGEGGGGRGKGGEWMIQLRFIIL